MQRERVRNFTAKPRKKRGWVALTLVTKDNSYELRLDPTLVDTLVTDLLACRHDLTMALMPIPKWKRRPKFARIKIEGVGAKRELLKRPGPGVAQDYFDAAVAEGKIKMVLGRPVEKVGLFGHLSESEWDEVVRTAKRVVWGRATGR